MSAKRKVQTLVILVTTCLSLPFLFLFLANLDPSVLAAASGWYGYNGNPVCPEPTSLQRPFHGLEERRNQVLFDNGSPIQYLGGVLKYTADGISFPSPGFGFSHRLTYNNNHEGGTESATDGNIDLPTGWNWHSGVFQLVDMGSDEIRRVGPGTACTLYDDGDPYQSGPYLGQLGADAKIEHDESSNEMTLHGTNGATVLFHDFDSANGDKKGALKSITHASGDQLSVDYYDAGENSNLQDLVKEITDTSGRKWVYYYIDDTGDTNNRRVSKVEAKDGATVLAKVEYLYYDSLSSAFASGSGTNGDLMRIVVTERDSNGLNIERTTLFRYWTGSWSDPSNLGAKHKLKYIVGPQSYVELDGAVADPLKATDSEVADHADHNLEYDANGFVTKATIRGAGCSCGGAEGTYTFSYSTNGSWTSSSGFDVWKVSVTQTNPDGTVRIVDVNGAGSIINDVLQTDASYGGSDQRWITHHDFDSAGRVTAVYQPSACTSYNTSTHAVSLESSEGLIRLFAYDSNGNLTDRKIKEGTSGTAHWLEKIEYDSTTVGDNTFYYPDSRMVFRSDNTTGTGGDATTQAFTFYTDSLLVQEITVTHPAVPSGENGSGTTATHKYYFDTEGQLQWEKDEVGLVTYRSYHSTLGKVTSLRVDADTDFLSPPSEEYENSDGLDLRTTYTYRWDGKLEVVKDPEGRRQFTHYTRLSTGQPIVARYGHVEEHGDDILGPCHITVHDFDGNVVTTAKGVPTDQDDDFYDDFLETQAELENAFVGDLYERTEYVYEDGHKTEMLVWTDADNSGATQYQTKYGYDDAGRLARVKDAVGTITRTYYTTDGQVRSRAIGTNDSDESDGLEEGMGDDDMTTVEVLLYDGETSLPSSAVGDGNLTTRKLYTDDSTSRDYTFTYDWRNRRTATDGPESFYEKLSYDNLGRVTVRERYEGSESASNLRAKSESKYDTRGRVFESVVYEVEQYGMDAGDIDDSLTTESWYDGRGALIKSASPSGVFTKNLYDAAGRLEKTYTCYDTNDSGYSEAASVSDDIVVSQVEYDRDDVGNVTLETRFDRMTTESDPGELDENSGVRYYVGSWYDDLHRLEDRADYGTNGGSTISNRPSTAPSPSDTILVTTYEYNDQGLLDTTYSPAGRTTTNQYDEIGRVVRVIGNYVNGIAGSGDDDRVTQIGYDAMSNVTSRKTYMSGSSDAQETEYVYGVTKGSVEEGDSELASKGLLQMIKYPVPEGTGEGSPSEESEDQESFAYNAQGELVWRKDQNEIVHEFTFDGLGRRTDDAVTTTTPLPQNVDSTILRISTEYDALDRPRRVTSYDAKTGGDEQNEVQFDYNGFGQIVSSWQEHEGAVDDDGTGGDDSLRVVYSYSEAESDPVSRLNWIQYPGSNRKVYFYYDDPSGGTDHAKMDWILGRPSAVSNSSSSTGDRVADYTYEGLGRVRERLNQETSSDLDIDYIYDRFGRVNDLEASGSSSINDLVFGYNRDSQVVWREESVGSVQYKDELYTYDSLGRLDVFKRGDLNAGKTDISLPVRSQAWNLDLVGNWDSVTTDGAGVTRTHNFSNEIDDVDTSHTGEDPTCDKNGNTTKIDRPQPNNDERTYVYDAWNRIVTVKFLTTTLHTYEYDGLGRKIRDTAAGVSESYFYSLSWQILSERDITANKTKKEYVWGLRYLDEIVERSEDKSNPADGDTRDVDDQSIFYVQDANWNVVALVDEAGDPVERTLYDPYGAPSFFEDDWDTRGSSFYSNRVLFTGRLWNPASFTYDYRMRDHSPYLGRFLQRDPIGIWGDPANWGNGYAYVGGDPVGRVDPFGLFDPLGIGEALIDVAADVAGDWVDRKTTGLVIAVAVEFMERQRDAERYIEDKIEDAIIDGPADTLGDLVEDAVGIGIGVSMLGAQKFVDIVSPPGGVRRFHQNEGNSIQHCMVACLTCLAIGPIGAAEYWVERHENVVSPDPNPDADIANDHEGFDCCSRSSNPDQCIDCCQVKYIVGELWRPSRAGRDPRQNLPGGAVPQTGLLERVLR